MNVPVIPAPERFRIVSMTRRMVLTVVIEDRTVVCDFDDSGTSGNGWPALRFSVMDDVGICSSDLAVREAFRTASVAGHVAVATGVSCGGVTEVPTISGTPADVAAVTAAIPHFYAEERDTEMRRAFRTVYRRLLRMAQPDTTEATR